MALSLSNFPIRALLLVPFVLLVQATTRTYDFNISWVNKNPDGAFERPVIGINGQWPIPQITATKGDRIVVNANNQLGNESTSLHFHGLFMNGTNHMDGVPGVTQCNIPPGSSLTYNFTANQSGTYWYHSHSSGQYPDGLRGPLIIHDPDSPYADAYDEELVLTFSDWYHDQIPKLLKSFLNVINPTGAEPVPESALMNDTQNLTVSVEAGKTYLIRMINMGAFAGQYVWFENHTMTIVELDGVWTERTEADMIYLTAAQRVSILLKTKNETSSNFAIVGSMDEDLFDTIPSGLNPNVTGWLVYDDSKALPTAADVDEFNPIDDFNLVPYDRQELYDEVDYSFNLEVKMDNLGDGINYAFFNDVTYVSPKVPTLYSALSTGDLASNLEVYGSNTNAFLLQKDQVVEIVVNNNDAGKHPFHLHGHNFQTVVRSDDDAGFYVQNETLPSIPMRRDTLMVRPNGNFVIRFKADNPDKCSALHCRFLLT
ncbi:MAG: hypothetical protein M1834_007380 [Cirrosporium novae-zelandiae]|nr:MAG: hypothetical protein M1834_007380 [Cirrosporium novae-zelandiae]